MSRRPPPDRAARNQETIKALLKLEGNKVCADCKRNKHPRWASWNLGVFLCIRCSGIHRGMGTHISRVKSVDLDSWTDEQLQSILKWGNSRANKYWEAKLAAGHMPSEAKIENFIRTKYESKRWIMDGPMPDPSTLDADGDDDVPLNIVQEKAKIERSASQRISSAPQQPQPRRQAVADLDLFGDTPLTPPARPSTADLPHSRTATRSTAPSIPARQAKTGESLLGLDFLDGSQAPTAARPASAASNPIQSTSTSRPDLKQSILSLYASAPKPTPPPAQSPHNRQPSFGGMSGPSRQGDVFSSLTNDLGGLSFGSSGTPKSPPSMTSPAITSPVTVPQRAPGSGFAGSIPPKSTPSAPQVTSPPLSGGSFFDSLPSKPPIQPKPSTTSTRPSLNGLDFAFTQAPAFTAKPSPGLPNDPFATEAFTGFASASPAAPPAPPPTKVLSALPTSPDLAGSPFNLSASTTSASKLPTSIPKAVPLAPQTSSALFDPWASGGDNGWGAPEPAPPKLVAPKVELGKVPSKITPSDIAGGWGSPISASKNPPRIAADEDFGGWTSASTTQTPVAPPAKPPGGFGSTSDPFDNPWG